MSKLVITDEVRQLISLAAPTAVRSGQDNPVVKLLQDIVDKVNSFETTTATTTAPTTTVAPTTTAQQL